MARFGCLIIVMLASAMPTAGEPAVPLVPEPPRTLDALLERYGLPDDGFGTLLVYRTRIDGIPAHAALLFVDGELSEITFHLSGDGGSRASIAGDADQLRKALGARFGPPTARVRERDGRTSTLWRFGEIHLLHVLDLGTQSPRHTVVVRFARG